MPYKDKETQRQATRKAVKRHRQGITKGITEDRVLHEKEGITPDLPEGITLYRYMDGKRQELSEVPDGFRVLSDGQVWKPLGISNLEVRSKPEGITSAKAARLLIICQSLNKFDVAQEVRYGINGPTMDIVSERLGAS